MLYLVAELGRRAVARAAATLALAVPAALAVGLAVQPASAREYAGIVVDARTGKTLYAHDADQYRYPASLTKMMTLYMVFEALDAGKVSLRTRVPFSAYASSRPPSKIGVRPGGSITIEQAIYALVTKSANDVATAVGEKLGGTESGFARMMTRKARGLGMKRTTFRNASGLPNAEQRTTARDMARLGLALREHHPRYYRYFSTRSWNFGRARYGNHNKLLGRVRGVDGIKTGYIRASGFNLVSSVKSNGRSIVAVVIGGRTGASRNAQMQKLIGKYLPRASKRGRGNLIAKSGAAAELVAGLPKTGPRIARRPSLMARVAPSLVAKAKPAVPAPARAYAPAIPAVPVPAAPVPVAAVPASPGIDRSIETASVAPAEPPKGWVIQIAATDTMDGAASMHAKARKAIGGKLSGRTAFVETIDKDGKTLHRVRFGGFSGKSQAWSACKALKRKRFGCYALNAG